MGARGVLVWAWQLTLENTSLILLLWTFRSRLKYMFVSLLWQDYCCNWRKKNPICVTWLADTIMMLWIWPVASLNTQKEIPTLDRLIKMLERATMGRSKAKKQQIKQVCTELLMSETILLLLILGSVERMWSVFHMHPFICYITFIVLVLLRLRHW